VLRPSDELLVCGIQEYEAIRADTPVVFVKKKRPIVLQRAKINKMSTLNKESTLTGSKLRFKVPLLRVQIIQLCIWKEFLQLGHKRICVLISESKLLRL